MTLEKPLEMARVNARLTDKGRLLQVNPYS
jgi:hypothetical protein